MRAATLGVDSGTDLADNLPVMPGEPDEATARASVRVQGVRRLRCRSELSAWASAVLWTAAVSWGTPCVGCTRAPSHADSAARDESSQGSLEARGSGGSLEATGSEDLQGAQAATVQGAVHDDLSERRLELDLVHPELGPMPTLVHVPARTHEQQRLPILIAFHGMGESRKGPQRGVLGWLQDYALEETLHRLSAPPLTRGDFAGFVERERLLEINRRLEERPYRPLIVVTPYLPDVLGGPRAFETGPSLGRFVVAELLPAVRAAAPASDLASATGVDGVSLGGRAALLVGFSEPEAFGAVGALQAAVDAQEIATFAQLAKGAIARNPRLAVRLVSSWGDYYLDVNRQLHRALTRAGVANELFLALGTHSYQFNRGPGGYEMLLFHERALRR